MVESERPWSEVVSTDFVLSVKTGRWYEVLEIWPKGDRIHWRPRGVELKKPFSVDPAATVMVRRSEMGHAVDIVVGIMSSGPNGYRDAGTDQMDPFISRVRGIQRLQEGTWGQARQYVLDELHGEAMER